MHSKLTIAVFIGAIFILRTGGSPPAGGTPPDDACSLLTQAQVSAVLGISVGASEHPVPKLCSWTEPGNPSVPRKKVVLTIISMNGFNLGKTPAGKVIKTPVDGIGDDAYYMTLAGIATTLHVRKGSTAFSIDVRAAGLSVDQIKTLEKSLAQDVLTKL